MIVVMVPDSPIGSGPSGFIHCGFPTGTKDDGCLVARRNRKLSGAYELSAVAYGHRNGRLCVKRGLASSCCACTISICGGCFRIVRMIVIVYGQGARSVHIDNAIVTVVVTNVMPLQNREVMQGVGYSRIIHTVGDVVGRSFWLFGGIAHGHADTGGTQHIDVIFSIADRHNI